MKCRIFTCNDASSERYVKKNARVNMDLAKSNHKYKQPAYVRFAL